MNDNPLSAAFQRQLAESTAQPPVELSPFCHKYLVIGFTPRSGSSWLTDRIAKTGRLGGASEYLNASFFPKLFQRFPATSLPDYVHRVLKGTSSPSGVASLEVTWFHLKDYAAAIGLKPLRQDLPKPFDGDSYYAWLRRRDFVAQGVSLLKATQSGLFHAPQKPHQSAPETVTYDGDAIKKWCKHIMQQEFGFERWFERQHIKPLRLFYEDMVRHPNVTLQTLFDFVQENGPDNFEEITSPHTKLGNTHSDALIQRFREEESAFIDEWEADRGSKPAF